MTVAAGVMALAVACSGDDNGDGSAGDTSGTDSDDTDALSPEAEVEAAYLAYWDMLDRLAEAPDPDDPEIPERASGEALLEVVAGLTNLVEQRHTSETGPLYGHSIDQIEVVANKALLRDCVIDDGTILDQATGEVVGGGEVAAKLLEVTLVLEEERWKVNRVDRVATHPSATSCEE